MSLLQLVQKAAVKKVPAVRTGHTVRVHQKIKEGEKERVQIFEGLIIKVNSGYGADKSFTVRKVVEGIGVERIFPLYSPNIIKIEIKKQSKVRRAKLFYMRDRSGKSARLKSRFFTEGEIEASVEELSKQKALEDAADADALAAAAPAEETTDELVETAETASEEVETPTEEVAEEAPADVAETPAEEDKKE